jgi:hypothetical protein
VNERKLLNNSAVKGQLYTLAQALLKKGIVKVLKNAVQRCRSVGQNGGIVPVNLTHASL